MLELHIEDGNTVLMSGRFDAAQIETAKKVLSRLNGSCILDLAGGTVTVRNMNRLVGDVFTDYRCFNRP